MATYKRVKISNFKFQNYQFGATFSTCPDKRIKSLYERAKLPQLMSHARSINPQQQKCIPKTFKIKYHIYRKRLLILS